MSDVLASQNPALKQDSLSFLPTYITAGGRNKLVFKAVGGTAELLLQVMVVDANGTTQNGVGFPGMGAPLATNASGEVEWDFLTNGCAGGYVKWRVAIEASKAQPDGFHIVGQIWRNGAMVLETVAPGVSGGQMITSFVNGVRIIPEPQ